MAENLKKFFKKKKLELKFKKAGPGHRLDADTTRPSRPVEQPSVSRTELSTEAKQAAAAALARLQNTTPSAGFGNPSLYRQTKSEVKRELSSERAVGEANRQVTPAPSCKEDEIHYTHYAADGVYFRCPLLGPEVLSKSEWRAKIKEYLYEQLESEKGLTASLIIHNCNSNTEKINMCVETLCKCLQNIIDHPGEEKYRKIRMSSRVFQEKIAGIEGSLEFLEAAGFVKEQIPGQDKTEDYLVFSEERMKDPEYLKVLLDALENAERIDLELDRNIQVLQPAQAERRTKLPDDFYRYTAEELKKEHQARTESLEMSLQLRTKAMREKQEQKEMKKYRYALVRVRFPDGIFLQGTFSVYEKYEEVVKFVEENIAIECSFSLLIPDIGKPFAAEDFSKSLMELRLVPASVLIFKINEPTNEEILSYLKPDIAVLLQNL